MMPTIDVSTIKSKRDGQVVTSINVTYQGLLALINYNRVELKLMKCFVLTIHLLGSGTNGIPETLTTIAKAVQCFL